MSGEKFEKMPPAEQYYDAIRKEYGPVAADAAKAFHQTDRKEYLSSLKSNDDFRMLYDDAEDMVDIEPEHLASYTESILRAIQEAAQEAAKEGAEKAAEAARNEAKWAGKTAEEVQEAAEEATRKAGWKNYDYIVIDKIREKLAQFGVPLKERR